MTNSINGQPTTSNASLDPNTSSVSSEEVGERAKYRMISQPTLLFSTPFRRGMLKVAAVICTVAIGLWATGFIRTKSTLGTGHVVIPPRLTEPSSTPHPTPSTPLQEADTPPQEEPSSTPYPTLSTPPQEADTPPQEGISFDSTSTSLDHLEQFALSLSRFVF